MSSEEDQHPMQRLGNRMQHQGAALSLILEEKMALGLSAPSPERKPMESLSEVALVRPAIAERKQRAHEDYMRLASLDPDKLRDNGDANALMRLLP